jgi:D-cysteine desulfhydrase
MDLARFPRRRYTPAPTPIEPMARLSAALGGPELWIKRDDTLGLAGGGNKTRKLEFLVAEALAQGADTLITCGAPQSNHCRLTLAAAAREGLSCRLVIEAPPAGGPDRTRSGNALLFRLLGAEAVIAAPNGADLDAAMAAEAARLSGEGRRAYAIGVGGSSPLGAVGYAACADEILAQSFAAGTAFDHIVLASGSAGTHAGLLSGLHARQAPIAVTGINVSRPRAPQEAKVAALTEATAALLGLASPPPAGAVEALGDWVGPGYAVPTPQMVEAVRLAARLEGVLLDPVYTGKAMAGLIALVRAGRWRSGERVLFLHTGGAPALFAYEDAFAP